MTYNDLKKQIERFHTGEITKKELAMAIAMWQRTESPGLASSRWEQKHRNIALDCAGYAMAGTNI